MLYGAFSLLAFDPKPFVGGDNATYILLSQAMVQGRGFVDHWMPGEPPHTVYSFGFPALLLPVSLLHLSYSWYKVIPWLSGLCCVLLVFPLFRRQGPPLLAAVACVLMTVNPSFIEYSHWVLSELPFMAFMLLTLWLLMKWEKDDNRPWFFWLMILAAAAAYNVRNTGVALVGGIFIYLMVKRRFRDAGIFIAAFAVLILPWTLRNRHFGTVNYLDWLLVSNPYQVDLGRVSAGGLVERFFQNLWLYSGTCVPQLLFPAVESWGLGSSAWFGLALVSLPMVLGLLVRLIRAPTAFEWITLCYLGIVLLWPTSWTDLRYLLPVLPLLILYLLAGYHWLLTGLFKRAAGWPSAALLVLLLIANLSPSVSAWGKTLKMQAALRQGDSLAGYDPAWRSFFDAARWVRDNTPPQAVVVSRKPNLFYLSTGRQSFAYPYIANLDSVRKAILQADYIMVEPISGTVQKYLIPAIQPLIDSKVKVIYMAGNPPTYVLQVVKESLK